MGSPARNDSFDAIHPVDVVPVDPPEPSTVAVALLPPTRPELIDRRAGELLASASRTISRAYARALVNVSDTSASFAFRTRELASRARVRTENFKNDRPLKALGMFAGMAFAVGVAARVWRSRQS